jgi:protein ImuA
MHELLAGESEAPVGFAAALLSRFTGASGAVLWCGRTNHPYAPGLSFYGVDPNRLIFARTATDIQTLWAMEEGLRCPELSAVLGAVSSLDLTEGRRLQLAAERHGVTALVLRRSYRWGEAALASSAAATRWKATPLPSPRDGMTLRRWRVERLRCRGAMPGEYIVRWSHAAGGIALAAEAGDGYSTAARSDAA